MCGIAGWMRPSCLALHRWSSRLQPLGTRLRKHFFARMGLEMAAYAVALIRRFRMETLPVEVVAAGRLFQTDDSLLMKTFVAGVQQAAPAACVVRPSLPPVAGPVQLALDFCEPQDAPHAQESLRRSLQGFTFEKPASSAPDFPDGKFTFPFFH